MSLRLGSAFLLVLNRGPTTEVPVPYLPSVDAVQDVRGVVVAVEELDDRGTVGSPQRGLSI